MSAAEAKTGRLPPASDANGPDVARITLRRAAEQAREALTDWVRVYQDEKDMAALTALDAALAEPKETFAESLFRRSWEAHRAALAEPNAKPEPYTLAELFAQFAAKQRPLDADMAAIINANLDSLYITDEPAAALAQPDAKREPATVEQIDEEYIGPVIDARWHDFEAGFRAAERFHGIRAREQQPGAAGMSGAEADRVLTDEIGWQPCRYPACVDDSGRCARLFAGECSGPGGVVA
jgi:hypothetical protein